jgi:dihydroneopterin aldolase
MTIHLVGIHAFGRHGVTAEERGSVQEFSIDLDVDVWPATDDLDATADYREIVRVARGVIEDQSFELLETLAAEVASAVRAVERVSRVRAVVHKPGAAKRLGADDVSASAELA